jgi:maltose O-acetyltransferase
MKKKLLLQVKFFVVAFLNVTYNFVPNPLRRYYLRLFGIRFDKNGKNYIHRRCKFFHIGNLIVGHNSCINFGCYLDNRRMITIGNNVSIAHNTKIYTLGHDISSRKFSTVGKSVRICDNVFIFSNSMIMPGVTIGEGAIILSGSVVTKDVEPWTIVGGNPAKKLKDRLEGVEYQSNYGYWFAL